MLLVADGGRVIAEDVGVVGDICRSGADGGWYETDDEDDEADAVV